LRPALQVCPLQRVWHPARGLDSDLFGNDEICSADPCFVRSADSPNSSPQAPSYHSMWSARFLCHGGQEYLARGGAALLPGGGYTPSLLAIRL
jgi:hypothetical protein